MKLSSFQKLGVLFLFIYSGTICFIIILNFTNYYNHYYYLVYWVYDQAKSYVVDNFVYKAIFIWIKRQIMLHFFSKSQK